jgi:hypothetical protein
MANHLRRQAREGIGTALTGLTTTGSRVFQSRVYPLEVADLPGILIYSEQETAEVQTIHSPRVLDRLLRVRVVAVAKATADLDDVLDGICKEVEIVLAMPVTALAGIAKLITLISTDIELSGTTEQPTGRAEMTYEVEYFTAENAPDVAL